MKKIFLFILLILNLSCNAEKQRDYAQEKTSYDSYEERGGYDKDEKIEAKEEIKEEIKETERKIIKNGTISIDVKNINEAEKNIEKEAKKFEGYISSSSLYTNYGTIVVKIPSEKFDDFLNIVPSFGKITYKSINVEDVTKKYYDLERRIENKKILQQRYQNYLRNATRVEDLLNIERELNNVTSEIESLELEFKNLSHLIAFSTLTINISVPGVEEVTRYFPSLKKGFVNFGYAIVNFLYVLLFAILYIVVFGVPITIIIALIYFITFGKIGFVRKLFKKLSGK